MNLSLHWFRLWLIYFLTWTYERLWHFQSDSVDICCKKVTKKLCSKSSFAVDEERALYKLMCTFQVLLDHTLWITSELSEYLYLNFVVSYEPYKDLREKRENFTAFEIKLYNQVEIDSFHVIGNGDAFFRRSDWKYSVFVFKTIH